jgi:hypothetical protein
MTEALALTSLVISAINLTMSVKLWIEWRAKEKSTHTIQYVPLNTKIDKDGFEIIDEELKKKLAGEDDELQ